MSLPDLGTHLNDINTNLKADVYLLNCRVDAVIDDEPGMANVVFVIDFDNDRFMGNILVKGSPEQVVKKLAALGDSVNFLGKLRPDMQYTTDDGQVVIPFVGDIYTEKPTY